MIHKILIAVDDSKYAEHAAEYGFKLAHSFNAHVGLLNILEPISIPMTGNGADEILGTPIQGIMAPDLDILDPGIGKTTGKFSEKICRRFTGY